MRMGAVSLSEDRVYLLTVRPYADIQKEKDGRDIEHIHDGAEYAEYEYLIAFSLAETFVFFVEIGFFRLLFTEYANYLHTRKVFG